MAGPALGVWLATSWHTGWALFAVRDGRRRGRLRALVRQPAADRGRPPTCPLHAREPARPWRPARRVRTERLPCPRRGAASSPLRVAAVYLAAACSTLVLSGTDVAIVAALRSFDATPSIGWVLALWGAGLARRRPRLRRVAPVLLRLLAARRPRGHDRARRARRRRARASPSSSRCLRRALCPDDHGHRRAAEPASSRALPRRDDGLARVGHDRRLGGGCARRRVRHRPRRLAVGLPRRLGGRRRGCRPRSSGRREVAGCRRCRRGGRWRPGGRCRRSAATAAGRDASRSRRFGAWRAGC